MLVSGSFCARAGFLFRSRGFFFSVPGCARQPFFLPARGVFRVTVIFLASLLDHVSCCTLSAFFRDSFRGFSFPPVWGFFSNRFRLRKVPLAPAQGSFLTVCRLCFSAAGTVSETVSLKLAGAPNKTYQNGVTALEAWTLMMGCSWKRPGRGDAWQRQD